ncbi:MAG: hypothetical protein JKY99_12710, partial [Rhizobiales bacterium]|nr:hypothetical protein [Hyphomicrobiales bacterium]
LADTSVPKAANDKVGIIYVKNNRELLRPKNVERIAKELAELPTPSREIINWLADMLFIDFEGIILWPNGKEFKIGDEDLDRVFDNDTVSRWLRSLRQFADKPVVQTAPSTLAERYRLLDAALQIKKINAA